MVVWSVFKVYTKQLLPWKVTFILTSLTGNNRITCILNNEYVEDLFLALSGGLLEHRTT